MTESRQQLLAFIATLFALVSVFIAALVAAALAPALAGKMELFGLGTITGGLIGVLRFPTLPRSSATVGTADSINVTPPPQ